MNRSVNLVRLFAEVGADVQEGDAELIQGLYLDTDEEKIKEIRQLIIEAKALYEQDTDNCFSLYNIFLGLVQRWENYLLDIFEFYSTQKGEFPRWSSIKDSLDLG
jgi:hypothetical protein